MGYKFKKFVENATIWFDYKKLSRFLNVYPEYGSYSLTEFLGAVLHLQDLDLAQEVTSPLENGHENWQEKALSSICEELGIYWLGDGASHSKTKLNSNLAGKNELGR